ncbi:MAG: hypothetical protein CFH19_01213 [Alphaproteobacteria bacterium MarineAlpha5_Bin9]|nr:MAG: hypothetical protein CFH19_01213 [Alphaproteobacteria bacterium MarineAlpha5_Bin9]
MIQNFWLGKIPLWKSYWIIGELLNACVIILIFNLEINYYQNIEIFQNLPLLTFSSLHFINKAFLFIWTIFITIGIWRSAENYNGKFMWIALTLIVLSYRIFTLRELLI